jgi:hypothetical protein
MVAFEGYFDESGKEDDPYLADSGCAVAGYVTTAYSWLEIESEWQAVLARPEFKVDYLHMKEFAHSVPGSPFESWRDDAGRRAAFLSALGDVIRKSDLFGVGAVIRLSDLRRFNAEEGLSLNAYSLGIYACLIELSQKYPSQTVKTIWDRGVANQELLIARAREYAATDKYYPGCGNGVQITPLRGVVEGTEPPVDRSSRNVPALQIADFAAYELLKSHRDKNV